MSQCLPGWQRVRGVLKQKSTFHTHFLYPEQGTVLLFAICKHLKLQYMGRNKMKRLLHVVHSLDQEPLHSLSTLVYRHWRYSCQKKYQAFPLRFCILQVIVGRPGNEAKRAAQHVLPAVTGATKNQILVDNLADQHSTLQKHLGYFNHILGCLSCISVTKKCY